MAGYLLLRNNKESGPYSLTEIIAKQLKPHDLIWVEGKSAAWRYPEELPELKSHVELSTESSMQVDTESLKSTVVADPEPVAASLPAPVETPSPSVDMNFAPPPAKKISVILPDSGGKQDSNGRGLNGKPKPEPDIAPSPVYSQPVLRERQEPVENRKQAEPVETRRVAEQVRKQEPVADFTPSNPVNSAPKQYVHHSVQTAQEPMQSGSFDTLKYVVWGVALLLGGVVVGIGVDRMLKPKNAAVAKQQPVDLSATGASADSVSNTSTIVYNPSPDLSLSGTAGEVPKPKPLVTRIPRKKPVDLSAPLSAAAAALAKTDSQENRKAQLAKTEDRDEAKERARASIKSQLSVSNGKYKVGAFGGINDLQVTLTNNSAYTVDDVAVQVNYILANKRIYKTETLRFHGLHPGAAIMQEAPKCSRGIKVECLVSSINSKELGLAQNN